MSRYDAHLALLALALTALTACGSGAPREEGAAAGEEGQQPAAAAPAVDPATAATITGRVAFEGTPPAPQPIDMSEEPSCAAKHPGGAKSEDVVVNNGALQNVFLYVKEGLGDRTFPTPAEGVVIDQHGCTYVPHVLGLQVGQKLVIRNSDGILHNINAKPKVNRGFNISQPTNMESTRTFAAPEVMIPVECDVHGWMRAYIGVLPHPYFAVSGPDGSFTIAGLPPGTYTIEAWHERFGTQTAQVTVGAAETKEVAFTFRPSATAAVPLGRPIDLHDHGTGTAHTGGR